MDDAVQQYQYDRDPAIWCSPNHGSALRSGPGHGGNDHETGGHVHPVSPFNQRVAWRGTRDGARATRSTPAGPRTTHLWGAGVAAGYWLNLFALLHPHRDQHLDR